MIDAPAAGATVQTKAYRFRGTTEPGCTVIAAGRYEAEVDAAGSWSIVLVLNEGGNIATFTSTDPAGNTTTAKVAVYYEPPIRNSDFYSLNGQTPTRFPETPLAIAFVTLDEGVDAAAAGLIDEFGEPDEGESEGLEGGRWYFGTASSISWLEADEWLLSATADRSDGLRLSLFDGIVLGDSTVADLGARWGEPLHITDDYCHFGATTEDCLTIVYTRGFTEIRISWETAAVRIEDEWIIETISFSGYWWPMMFIDNGAVSPLGTISEHCDERGCRVHSDRSYWASRGGVTPFYSWGGDCLDEPCEYVAIFIGTAPPADVPLADRWKVQTSESIGGLLLAKRLDDGLEVIGSTYARQSSDRPIRGPVQVAEAPHIYLYTETTDGARYEAWEIDLDAVTITRLVCEGPDRVDCRPVWE